MVSTSRENLSALTLVVPEILKGECRCIIAVKQIFKIFEDTSTSPLPAMRKN